MKWLLVVWVLSSDFNGGVDWQVTSTELYDIKITCLHHRTQLERLYGIHNGNPKLRTQKVECIEPKRVT